MERLGVEIVVCKPRNTKKYEVEIAEIIEYFNAKTNRKISPTTEINHKTVITMLRKGYVIEDFKAVIDLKSSQWLNKPNMKRYLRPETFFSRIHFPVYLQESKVTIDNVIEIEDKKEKLLICEAVCKPKRRIEFDEDMYDKALYNLKCMQYDDYLLTKHWLHFRKEALKHFNYKCQMCGNIEELNIHHNNYINRGRETFNDVICLCHECHEKFHNIAKED